MAAETLLTIREDENERARLLNEYRIILDYQSGLAYAKKLGKIESAVNAIKSLNITVSEAIRVLELDPEYRDDIIAELNKHNISFTV